ncbi:PAAR domain-containing protein [Pseudescherichia vulneris]|uniref:PAAR domain-containing protein n=1 Tax=Pseudescherichia vulneris TaxID=566 RepID=UPI0028D26BB5|nr:PAAR domain-containing protein [Pseudescherichia vulneris]
MVTQRALAKLGNKTRYGHIVSASSTIFDEDHNPLVRAGDKAWCDVCKGAFEINATYTGVLEAGFIAGDGDLVLCHCKDNFVIAISGFTGESHPGMMSAKPAAFGIAPEQQTEQEPEQHAQTVKKKTGIDAGFAILPYGGTTEAWQRLLFTDNPPAGAKELFATLNGADKKHKASSILLLVDPDKQDDEQIAHMKAAKARVDAALAPLSIQQANFLFKHKDTIEMFAAAASTANDTYGYSGQATEAAKGYFEQVEKILVEIEKTYKNQYITSGTLIGEQFFVERRRLFGQLDSVLKMFMKHRFIFNEYTDLKRALGLSSRAITRRWNEAGVSDIEGYATHIEKLAKYVKWMETAGKIGIGLSALDTAAMITEACTVGRDCAKTSFTSIGEFSGSLAGGALASRILQGSAASSICAVVLGTATIEAAGAGALLCTIGVSGGIAYGTDKTLSELSGATGEFIGEKLGLYEVTSND